MKYICKDPKFSSTDNNGTIDLIWDHPEHGEIPFTATHDDCEAYGREIFQLALDGEFGPIAPYVAPPPPVPHSVTRRQGRLALLEVGKLDDVEAAVESAGMAAQIEYEADTWERSNAFLQGMWAQLGGTESELDDLFILASEK